MKLKTLFVVFCMIGLFVPIGLATGGFNFIYSINQKGTDEISFLQDLDMNGYNINNVGTITANSFVNQTTFNVNNSLYLNGFLSSYYVNNSNTTINNWSNLYNFPSACINGKFVTQVGSSLTCAYPSYNTSSDMINAVNNTGFLNVTANDTNYFNKKVSSYYVNNSNTTINNWSNLYNFPSACNANNFVSAVGVSLTCGVPSSSTTNQMLLIVNNTTTSRIGFINVSFTTNYNHLHVVLNVNNSDLALSPQICFNNDCGGTSYDFERVDNGVSSGVTAGSSRITLNTATTDRVMVMVADINNNPQIEKSISWSLSTGTGTNLHLVNGAGDWTKSTSQINVITVYPSNTASNNFNNVTSLAVFGQNI